MLLVLGLGLFMLFILIILLYSRIYIHVYFTYKETEHKLIVSIYLWRIRIIQKHIPMKGASKSVLETFKNNDFLQGIEDIQKELKDSFIQIKQLHYIIIYFLHRTRFHQFRWHTCLGTGEASSTGILLGGLWMLKGIIIKFMVDQSHFSCRPDAEITPLFHNRQLSSNFDCMVSIRIGQAIYAYLKLFRKISSLNKAHFTY